MPRIVDTVATFDDASKRRIGNYNYVNATVGETDAFINKLKDEMILAGWSLKSTGTETGHPTHTLESAQSPWWNDLVIPPSTYIGKLRIKIFANSNSIVRLQGRNTTETFIQDATRVAQFNNGTLNNWRYNINPFQIMIQHPTGNFNFMLYSVIHTPKWLQEAGLEDAFICTSGGSNAFQIGLYTTGNCFYKIKSTGYNLQVDRNISFDGPRLSGVVNFSNQGANNIRFPNPNDDPSFNDNIKRAPFHIPATVALNLSDPPVNAENSWRWFGWYWDGIVMGIIPTTKPYVYSFDNGMQFEGHTLNNSAGSTLNSALCFRIA